MKTSLQAKVKSRPRIVKWPTCGINYGTSVGRLVSLDETTSNAETKIMKIEQSCAFVGH
jgi:hypothetical protein